MSIEPENTPLIITFKSQSDLREGGDESVLKRLGLPSDTEYAVHFAGDGARPGFLFSVAHNEVRVTPVNGRVELLSGPGYDWRNQLGPHEKVNIMNLLLDHYRKDSDDPKFKVASALVSENGNIYIAYNGVVLATPSKRQCAEQVGSSIAADREKKKHGVRGQDLKFTEAYIQGGGQDVHIMGPCGDCTHMLSKHMDPAASIYVLPSNRGKSIIPLDTEATGVDEVESGHAWKTTPGHLNRHRVIELKDNEKVHLVEGTKRVKREIRDWFDADDGRDPNAAIFGIPFDPKGERRSRLDVPLDRLNDFMEQQILITAADRLFARAAKRGIDVHKLSDDQIDALVEDEIKWVRCAVVQRDDGRLFVSTTAKTVDERSSTAAEQNAYRQGAAKHGQYGYPKIWVKEYNPRDAQRGVMRTSAKFAVESMLKTASKQTGTVDFYYIPMTAGGLTAHEVSNLMYHREAPSLYPSAHVGEPTNGVLSALYQGKVAPTRGTTLEFPGASGGK